MDRPPLGMQLDDWYRGLWVLSALRVADARGLARALVDGGSADALAEATGLAPGLVRALLEVFQASGWLETQEGATRWRPDVAPQLAGPASARVFADLRSTLGQHAQLWRCLADPAAELEGWRADDTDVVTAQGELSEATMHAAAQALVPALPGLDAALRRPGAAALDVGAGAAGGLIALATRYPELRLVGLEPAPLPLELARRAVEARGFASRIELRAHRVEQLDDRDAYVLAYVAQMFLPDAAWAEAIARVFTALEPGGFLLTAATSLEGDDLPAAISRLRTHLWGGGRRPAASIVEALRRAGFESVRTPPGGGAVVPVVAQKPA
jgi:predicted O-methyltransferase YrrM